MKREGFEPKTESEREELKLAPKTPLERAINWSWAIYFALVAIIASYLFLTK